MSKEATRIKVDDSQPSLFSIGRNIGAKILHRKTPSSYFLDIFESQDKGSSLELVTMKQLAEGVKAAGASAAKFRPPGE